jgi:hypothetical protein
MTGEHKQRPSPLTYTDLRLELRSFNPEGGTYQVSLAGAIGEYEGTARLDRGELDESLLELQDGGIEEEEDLIAFGRALADRLLPNGQVRTQVAEAIRRTGVGTGVRLRLAIREPSLAELPWEYTYLSLLGRDDPSDFLVRYPTVSIVRDEPLPLPHLSISPREAGRLRLVAVTANAPGYLQLDLAKERRAIEAALGGNEPATDYQPILVDAAAPDLQAALVGGADVFHFAGHGGLRDGKGFLALPSEDGTQAEMLDAGTLAGFLQAAGVRVALLGACESGRRDALSRWTGVVPALVAGVPGIPAVVAMQYRVRDSAAIRFSRAFYDSVAAGLSVDEAVLQGRLALFDPDDVSASWGIPALYLRSVDGIIFPRLAEQPSAIADALREAVNVRVGVVDEDGVVMGLDAADAESLRAAANLGARAVNVEATKVRGRGQVIGVRIGGGRKDEVTPNSAVEAARLRYARGEITREQFDQLMRDLGS